MQGEDEAYEEAMAILDDPDREFVCSDYIRLEVLPNATYFQYEDQVKAYRSFFESVSRWVTPSPELSERALDLACQFGLKALDALHVAAAERKGAELVTTEKPGKPMFRVDLVRITSVRSEG